MFKNRLMVMVLAAMAGLSEAKSATITQDFSTNPFEKGWKIFGDSSLFQWDATNQNLRVTWNSAQPNSYFYHWLGTILARDDDFTVAFDLQLREPPGPTPGPKTNTFEIAIGLLNLDQAM